MLSNDEILKLLYFDPTRPANWRAKWLGLDPQDETWIPPSRGGDAIVVRLREAGPGCVLGDDPVATAAIARARELALGDPWQRALVEAWLLTNEDDDYVALQTGISNEAIRWFRDIFFDVRPRLAALDWICMRVLGRFPQDSREAPRWLLRRVGYRNGSGGLMEVIPALAAFHQQAVPPVDLDPAGLPHGAELRAWMLADEANPLMRSFLRAVEPDLYDPPRERLEAGIAEVLEQNAQAAVAAAGDAPNQTPEAGSGRAV